MSEPFEIELKNHDAEEIYLMKGSFSQLPDGKAFDFKINHKESKFRGFGGSIDNPLPKISIMAIELRFSVHILDAINKNFERGL